MVRVFGSSSITSNFKASLTYCTTYFAVTQHYTLLKGHQWIFLPDDRKCKKCMNDHQLKCFMLNIFSDGQSASCVPSQGPPPHSAQVWQLSDRRLAPRNADDGPRVFTVTLKLLLEHTPGTEARHTGSSTAPQNERMRPEWRERESSHQGGRRGVTSPS